MKIEINIPAVVDDSPDWVVHPGCGFCNECAYPPEDDCAWNNSYYKVTTEDSGRHAGKKLLSIGWDEFWMVINYCPICGKKLEEATK